MLNRFLNFIIARQSRWAWTVFLLLILPILLHSVIVFAPPIFPKLKALNLPIGHIILLVSAVAAAGFTVTVIKRLVITKAQYNALLASIGEGVYAIDQVGNIIFMNEVAQEILGLRGSNFLGKKFYEKWLNEDENGNLLSTEKRPISLALSGKKVVTTLYYVPHNKPKIPVSLTVTPVILNGKIAGAIGVFRDITKEKEIDKAKTEFVSLASHQLRTPLSTVNWCSEMLLAGDAGKVSSEQKKYLEEIYHGNQRMVELVNALLNVSRLELGTFVIEPEPTDVVQLAENVIHEQKPQIDEKKLRVISTFSKKIPMIPADPKLLRMVYQNLLSNAVKYTPEGGKIDISLSLDDKNVLLKFSDTGYGIPQHQQDKIFTKLFRADNIREKDTEGTGLGLYIVKLIVEHSEGKIWFESEENKGTIFYVTLPLAGMKKKEGTKALS